MERLVAFSSTHAPQYMTSNYRQFEPEERHVNRVTDVWVLLLMLDRELYFSEDDNQVAVSAGQWYLQAPWVRQEGYRPSPAPRYYFIHFAADAQPSGLPGIHTMRNGNFVAPDDALLTLPIRGEFAPARFLPLCDRLERVRRTRPHDQFVRQAVFLEILSALADTLQAPRLGSAELAQAVMDHLCAHFTEDMPTRQLAQQFHFSADYLCRVFKQEYGRTPKEHIQQLRMELAMELLVTTGMPVTQIAEAVGYTDFSVFYKAFTGRVGKSPSAWRHHRQNNGVKNS